MAEMKISNTLVNDTSDKTIAYAEQLKQQIINWAEYNHVTEKLGPNNRPNTQNLLNNLFLRVYEEFLTFLNNADATDQAINTWKEIEAFLAGYTDDKTLASIVAQLNANIESRLNVQLADETGDSTTTTMTQKAITDAIDNVAFSSGEKVNEVGIDDVPTPGSNNLVKSNGVQNELALGAVYDVSAKNPTAGPNNDGKFESLFALLSDANLNTLIPTAVRKGGMGIKFVQSSDNKYVQARCMAQNFTTDVTQWQCVDDVPKEASKNLVESGGVQQGLAETNVNVFGLLTLNIIPNSGISAGQIYEPYPNMSRTNMFKLYKKKINIPSGQTTPIYRLWTYETTDTSSYKRQLTRGNFEGVTLNDDENYAILTFNTGTPAETYTLDFGTSLTKGLIGLGNVDNTSDANKPISNAANIRFTSIENSITAANGKISYNQKYIPALSSQMGGIFGVFNDFIIDNEGFDSRGNLYPDHPNLKRGNLFKIEYGKITVPSQTGVSIYRLYTYDAPEMSQAHMQHEYTAVSLSSGITLGADEKYAAIAFNKTQTTSSTYYVEYDSNLLLDALPGAFNATEAYFGKDAMKDAPVKSNIFNCAFGVDALRFVKANGGDNGKYNAAFGYTALGSCTTGNHNSAFGYGAAKDITTGIYNTALGEDAMVKSKIGDYNTCIGAYSGYNLDGQRNVCIGVGAAREMTTGSGNVMVGNSVGYNSYDSDRDNDIKTDTHCTFIGFFAHKSTHNVLDNTIALGYYARADKSNQVVIGDNNIAEVIIGGKKLTFNQDGTITWTART